MKRIFAVCLIFCVMIVVGFAAVEFASNEGLVAENWDLGDTPQTDALLVDLQLHNNTRKLIQLGELVSSCKCTQLHADSKEILSGGRQTMHATIDLSDPKLGVGAVGANGGRFSIPVLVKYSIDGLLQEKTFVITGIVIPAILVQEQFPAVRTFVAPEVVADTVLADSTISLAGDSISEVVASVTPAFAHQVELLKVDVLKLETPQQYRVRLFAKQPVRADLYKGVVTIASRDDSRKCIKQPYAIDIKSGFSVIPGSIVCKLGNIGSANVNIDGTPGFFSITSCKCPDGVMVSPGVDREYTDRKAIVVHYSKSPSESHSCIEIIATFQDNKQEVIVIPVVQSTFSKSDAAQANVPN